MKSVHWAGIIKTGGGAKLIQSCGKKEWKFKAIGKKDAESGEGKAPRKKEAVSTIQLGLLRLRLEDHLRKGDQRARFRAHLGCRRGEKRRGLRGGNF